MYRFFIHYSLHFIAPAGIAYLYKPVNWRRNWLVLISTMLIDIDHLFVIPIYNPNRCSVNFHFLHSFPFAYFYFLLLIYKRTRLLGIGLIFHLLTDFIDCFLK